ncbi:hypothetical protein HAX54_045586 [Datura stramonium]|uniref:Uncharacterized protein n=1 Tax=Datura stramonium TaxID=4076 RepID=A0ABS8WKS7_DATST|nr:hypothetical protein [Datura stramonium]
MQMKTCGKFMSACQQIENIQSKFIEKISLKDNCLIHLPIGFLIPIIDLVIEKTMRCRTLNLAQGEETSLPEFFWGHGMQRLARSKVG